MRIPIDADGCLVVVITVYRVINQDGMEYTPDNIDVPLSSRYSAKSIRNAGRKLKGPPKRMHKQDADFELALEKILNGKQGQSFATLESRL